MKLFTALVLAAVLGLAGPAAAQSTSTGSPEANNPSGQNVQPGAGGASKAGQPGLPGNKSGPAKDSGASSGASTGEGTAAGSDNSKVPGMEGNKSGPASKK